MKRRVLPLLVLLTACGERAGTMPHPTPTVAPRTQAAESGRLPRVLRGIGVVEARRDAWVSSALGGHVRSLPVEVGERVARGTLLVELAPGELTFAELAARRGAEGAAARLAGATSAAEVPEVKAAAVARRVAEDALRRAEKLHATGVLSEQDLVRARAELENAEAQLHSTRASAEAQRDLVRQLDAGTRQLRAQLDERRARAPFDGVIMERLVTVGALAAPGAPLLRVVDPESVYVRLELPQAEAALVTVGARARLEADGQERTGALLRASPGLVGPESARRVEIALEDAPWPVGARVRVALETSALESTVVVDAAALRRVDGSTRVHVVVEGRVEERPVELLRVEDGRAHLRRGVAVGEAFVVHAPDATAHLDLPATTSVARAGR